MDIIEKQMAITARIWRETDAAAARFVKETEAAWRFLAKMERDIRLIKKKKKDRNERILQLLRLGSPADKRCKCGGQLTRKSAQDEREQIEIFGERYELVCGSCNRVMYFPSHELAWMADTYFEAAKDLSQARGKRLGERNRTRTMHDMPIAFLLHQAGELYLKAVGSYDGAGEEDEDSELASGPGYEHRNHNLVQLLGKTFQYLQSRLSDYRGAKGTSSVSELVHRICKICPRTSELARYGYLFKEDDYPDHKEWDEIEPSLLELCELLRSFGRIERQL